MHRGKNGSGARPAVLGKEVNTGPAPAQTIWYKNVAPGLKESSVLFFLSQSGSHKWCAQDRDLACSAWWGPRRFQCDWKLFEMLPNQCFGWYLNSQQGWNGIWKEILGIPWWLVVRTLHFHCRDHGSIPGWGTVNKIPQAGCCGQNFFFKKKRKRCCGAWYSWCLVSGGLSALVEMQICLCLLKAESWISSEHTKSAQVSRASRLHRA